MKRAKVYPRNSLPSILPQYFGAINHTCNIRTLYWCYSTNLSPARFSSIAILENRTLPLRPSIHAPSYHLRLRLLTPCGQAVTLRGRTRTVSLDLISSTTLDFSCPFTCSLTCSLSEGTSSLSRAPSGVFNLTRIDLRSCRSPFDYIIPFPAPSVPSHSSSPGSIANSSRVGASCQARR